MAMYVHLTYMHKSHNSSWTKTHRKQVARVGKEKDLPIFNLNNRLVRTLAQEVEDLGSSLTSALPRSGFNLHLSDLSS